VASRCKSCDAPIRWGRTAAGNNIPVDFEPSEAGNVTLDYTSTPPTATVHGKDYPGSLFAQWPRFMPHHATCPQADEWRTVSRST
jgi:hypothetical protein